MSQDRKDLPVLPELRGAFDKWTDGKINLDDINSTIALTDSVTSFVRKPLEQLGDGIAAKIVEILRDHTGLMGLLNNLTGNPDAVKAVVDQWKALGQQIAAAQANHAAILRDMPSWTGPSAEAYAHVGDVNNDLYTVAGVSSNMMSLLLAASASLIAKTQEAVLKALKDLISSLLQAGAIALGTSWLSFGASLGGFIAYVGVRAAHVYNQFQPIVSKLMAALNLINGKLAAAKKAFDAAKAMLDAANGKIGTAAAKLPAERPGWMPKTQRYGDPRAAHNAVQGQGAGTNPAGDSSDPSPAGGQGQNAGQNGGQGAGQGADPTPNDPGVDRYRRDVAGLKKGAANAEKLKGKLEGADKFVQDNTGYKYPELPADKPLMPKPRNYVEKNPTAPTGNANPLLTPARKPIR